MSEVPDASEDVLRVEDLSTQFFTAEGQVNAVHGIDVRLERGEVFGIVGESGSGKSVTARSIMDLIEPPGEITDGEIWYRNEEFAEAVVEDRPEAVDGTAVELRSVAASTREALRGRSFSMIFQDPESSFNPSLTVGEQVAEAVEVQRRASARPRSGRARTRRPEYSFGSYAISMALPSSEYVTGESRERAIELLELVGIPDPAERADEYPHEYSGGMLQRAMIAQALAGEPDVLVADEPTTALDVTIQAQILDLLEDLQRETGMTVLLITHNLGVIARMCDRVGVMYAGEIVERGTLEDVFDRPVHPYTKGLLDSIPAVEDSGGRLQPIPGNVPSLLDHEMGDRCYFADRCPKAMEECLNHPPEFDVAGSDDHATKCYLAEVEYTESRALSKDYFADEAGSETWERSVADTEEEPHRAGPGTGREAESAPSRDGSGPPGGESE
ncbi:ABC transporter ATP-binding protein [Natronobacterium gregoryi]|uniref:Nickel import system ATP-binding protein NikD n=1 Tax=Natronobacterium gregoryi (strain ATCC 43098 / DSM 3393 / CCM 3738 / CIP 104747 / IAM 13177 / JCM 8860 / NBRC 102187 / NCIMB 2189 / SP2) TaxID=797304 RepID=L9XST4_NATGS|nr:ABC transporter ATP-binding protein [Natronobacterium gregoryi]ELY64587.1 oligopeptide/dipeptide ABC transporter ATPase [Natronobacterium gregoryi SP2]